jgi:hypothetical protein
LKELSLYLSNSTVKLSWLKNLDLNWLELNNDCYNSPRDIFLLKNAIREMSKRKADEDPEDSGQKNKLKKYK